MRSLLHFMIALAIFIQFVAPVLMAALIVYLEHQGGR